MEEQQIKKLEESISNLENKSSRIYVMIQDTKGNPKASVRYMYQFALALKNSGYNSIILHEKNDYIGVGEWLGEQYMEIPHKSIESKNLEVSPEDFIIIPEVYSFVMEQIMNLPCAKIVMCQAYDHMLETLKPGASWPQYGFIKCITTSESQKNYIGQVMRGLSIDIVEPFISDTFKNPNIPQKPIVSVVSRDQRKAVNFIKGFYLKFPQYRWVTFRDLRGVSEKIFSEQLSESFLSVWIDETSGYGTFPLESMKSGVLCLGIKPNLVPTWMNENNGIWIDNENLLLDFTADLLQNWLEDNISEQIYTEMTQTLETLPTEETFNETVTTLFSGYFENRVESFKSQLNKLQTEEEQQ
jgi:hypothetical protein